ncbi:SurA N-terminal domain-containing protein [Actinacidiphila rubida]|nr:SurA N-terminal domain-containing protein [Actinacidiphila rubida]
MVRRTAVPLAAAALLLASPALTACGSGPVHTGSAAVVGDHRITVATLQSQVNDLRSAAEKSPQGQQLLQSAGNLPTQLLGRLVEDQVLDRTLADQGLSVTASEVQQEHAAALQQFGGSETQLDAALLGQYGVAPQDIDHFFQRNVAFGKIIQHLGYQPGSDGGNAALQQAVVKTSKSVGVTINPRYGTWDASKGTIGSVSDPWVVNKTPTQTAAGGQGM